MNDKFFNLRNECSNSLHFFRRKDTISDTVDAHHTKKLKSIDTTSEQDGK